MLFRLCKSSHRLLSRVVMLTEGSATMMPAFRVNFPNGLRRSDESPHKLPLQVPSALKRARFI